MAGHPPRDFAHLNQLTKPVSADQAEEISCFNGCEGDSAKALWSAKGMSEHERRPGHPLQPTKPPDVTVYACHWNLTSEAERVGLLQCNISPT